jgi:DNA-binding NarL/FixJ family response regulator
MAKPLHVKGGVKGLAERESAGINGIKWTTILCEAFPGNKVLGLSMHIEKDVAAAMREAGAIGYLTKGGVTEDLVAAIRASVAVR